MRHVFYRPIVLTLRECFENEIFFKYNLTYLNIKTSSFNAVFTPSDRIFVDSDAPTGLLMFRFCESNINTFIQIVVLFQPIDNIFWRMQCISPSQCVIIQSQNNYFAFSISTTEKDSCFGFSDSSTLIW